MTLSRPFCLTYGRHHGLLFDLARMAAMLDFATILKKMHGQHRE